MAPGVREAPFEVTEEIREGIRNAVDAAGETIGARVRYLSRYRLSLRR